MGLFFLSWSSNHIGDSSCFAALISLYFLPLVSTVQPAHCFVLLLGICTVWLCSGIKMFVQKPRLQSLHLYKPPCKKQQQPMGISAPSWMGCTWVTPSTNVGQQKSPKVSPKARRTLGMGSSASGRAQCQLAFRHWWSSHVSCRK